MAIRLPSYLHRNRYGVFGFRVVVPRDLRLYFPRYEYRLSLSTGERQQARRLALGLAFYTREWFQKLRRMSDQQRGGAEFFEDLKSERERLEEMLFRSADDRLELDRRADAIAEALSTLGKTQSDLQALAADPEVGCNPEHQAKIRQIQSLLDQHLEALRPSIESLASVEEEFNGRVHRMREQYLTLALSAGHQNVVATQVSAFAEEKEKLSDFAAEIAAKAAAKAAGAFSAAGGMPALSRDSDKPLSAVIEAYCDNQNAEGNWTPKTDAENRAILALWLRIVGDQPIGGYGYEQHRAYKATLQRLTNKMKNSTKDTMTKDRRKEILREVRENNKQAQAAQEDQELIRQIELEASLTKLQSHKPDQGGTGMKIILVLAGVIGLALLGMGAGVGAWIILATLTLVIIVLYVVSSAPKEQQQAMWDTSLHGRINPKLVCSHCKQAGFVRTQVVSRKKGISGSKATGAIVTGGWSILATGLSRKEEETEAHCTNCGSTWHY